MENEIQNEIAEQPEQDSGVVDLTERTELAQDNDLSINDFLNARQGVEKTEEKVEGEKPVEETGEEKVPEEVVEEKVEEVVPEPQPIKQPTSREQRLKDIGITNPHAIKALKQMPNDAFNKYVETFDENKKVKEEITKVKKELEGAKKTTGEVTSLYNHPQGYLLNPQYGKLSAAVNQTSSVVRHWTTQLSKIRKGEQWNDLSNNNGQIGINPAPQEPTTEAEVAIEEQLQEAKNYYFDYSKQLKDLERTHNDTFKADVNFIKATEDKFFPGYDDENHPTKKVQQDLINLLPKSYQDHPLAKTLAKTVANNAIFAKEIANLKAQLAAKGGVKPKVPINNKVLPARNVVVNGRHDPKGMQDDDITVEDFQKARQGVL